MCATETKMAAPNGHMGRGDSHELSHHWRRTRSIVGMKGYQYVNWGGMFTCNPELFFQPSTIDEIKEIVDHARRNGKCVKVVGEGRSPSTINMTPDYMMSMKNYSRILHVDTERRQVKAESGVTLEQLHTCLHDYGLAMTNMGAIPYLSIGGILGAAVHGTGAKFGIIPTQVIAIELLTASGEVIECSRERHTDIFLAACCHIGALGVILNATIQCEPAFNVHLRTSSMSMDQLLLNLDEHVDSCDHFRFNYYPHTDSVITVYTNRTELAPYGCPPGWIWVHLLHHRILELLYYIGSFLPKFISVINNFYYRLGASEPLELIGRSDRVLHYDCPCKQHVTEWAIPRANAGAALRDLRAYLESGKFYAHFPVEVRFCKRDDIMLSPCYERDTCYINILQFKTLGKMAPHSKYWAVFESIARRYGGRPHWAKAHTVTAKEFRKMYPRFDDFLRIRKQLDPEELFLNEYLRRVLITDN